MKLSVIWFRRDLRIEDNTALNHALNSGFPVLPVFIFDIHIIDELPADDARISFIYDCLEVMQSQLSELGSSILVKHGDPVRIFKELLAKYQIQSVYTNRDYEPYAVKRDSEITSLLNIHGIIMHGFKDQVIFESNEIVKQNGDPYTVFTPYKRKWLEALSANPFQSPAPQFPLNFFKYKFPVPSLSELGFSRSSIKVKPFDLSTTVQYSALRNYPHADATSYLSPHLRFGTVSIRKVMSQVGFTNETFVSELIWREFFMQILHHFPSVVNGNFRTKYNGINWRNNEREFLSWCEGRTGYPMVDAGMRQLNQTGFMHNRVRMVTASFLCKHLLIDWRWGEAYFAQKLLDYELSSNNGNWQWAAGTGCDAAPYFRVFNPQEQLRKFDPAGAYVKKWISEYETSGYEAPIVEHKFARARALAVYRDGIAKYLPENPKGNHQMKHFP